MFFFFEFIIKRDQNRRINEFHFQNVHDFLLFWFSNKNYIFFQQHINWNENDDEFFNKNAIIHIYFDKFSNFRDIRTNKLFHNFDNFDDIRMFFVVVVYKFDNFNVSVTKLRLFVKNNVINFFEINQNFIKSLNMFKYFFSNFELNFFMIFENSLKFFNVYIIKKKRNARNMIYQYLNNNFYELRHKIDRVLRKNRHSYQINKNLKNN